ncbi:MAG: hypothetical protein OXG44_09165 [Gammaproteobacteria bacterium]|nr:hypothetical protein [Gammaproteobacteria bacterium]
MDNLPEPELIPDAEMIPAEVFRELADSFGLAEFLPLAGRTIDLLTDTHGPLVDGIDPQLKALLAIKSALHSESEHDAAFRELADASLSPDELMDEFLDVAARIKVAKDRQPALDLADELDRTRAELDRERTAHGSAILDLRELRRTVGLDENGHAIDLDEELASPWDGEVKGLWTPRAEPEAAVTASDGTAILYRSSINSVYGKPGCGKTWFALMAAKAFLERGEHVAWIDFDTGIGEYSERLRVAGIAETDRLHYFPGWPGRPTLAAQKASLVVIDTVEASGCPSDGGEIAKWWEKHVGHFAAAARERDAVVLTLDHVKKNKDDSESIGPIGSQAKLARVSGRAILMAAIGHGLFTRHEGGKASLMVHKDRHGHAKVGETIAVLDGYPSQSGEFVLSLDPDTRRPEPTPADRIAKMVADNPGMAKRAAADGLGGKRQYAYRDIDKAIDDGIIQAKPDGRTMRLYPVGYEVPTPPEKLDF